MEIAEFLAWRLRSVLAATSRFRSHRTPRNRVLCLVTGGLGDKLMALPAIRHLRAEFPGSEFTLAFLGLAPPFCESEADRMLSIPRQRTGDLMRLAMQGCDACFVNSIGVFDVRFELAAFLTGARDTRGPRFSTLPPNKTVYSKPYVFGEGHETAINLRGAGATRVRDTVAYPLKLPADARIADTPSVIFHPGSSSTGLANRWPAESYAALAKGLDARGYSVLAVGAPEEKSLLDSLRAMGGGALKVRSDLPLENLALLLSQARLVVANDSGIGHLAAAAGAPLITIMGANRPERVAPIGEKVSIVGPRCEYGGCYNDPRVPECKLCIGRITPDEVLAIALEKLS